MRCSTRGASHSRGSSSRDLHAPGMPFDAKRVVAFDGVLRDSDRAGVEEYLRRKWLAEVTLSGEPGRTP